MAAFVSLALFAPVARAELDAGVKKPYQLQVVLQIGNNRVFTPLFQEQVQRDVQNQLRIAFGDLARVQVKRHHPILREVEAKGLSAAVEGWDALSEQTTHVVLLDYLAGVYLIGTRFHDGATGQAGPLTKFKRINNRTEVAAAISQLIEESFSPVGAVTAVAANGQDVTLTLQGGDLGVPLDRWVARGDVFALSRIIAAGGQERAERVEWAMLEVLETPKKGVCDCRYRHRYKEDSLKAVAGTLGFRALRLPTATGVVKVQLLDDTTLKPLDGVRVRVQRPDSKAKPEECLTDRDGLAISKGSFAHCAWVQVLSGDTVRAQFPVALLEGRTVVARVKIQEDRESLASFEVRRDAWLRRVYDNVRMSSERALDLQGQLNQSLEAARDAGRKSLPLLDAEIAYLEREHDELGGLAREKKVSTDLREGQQQIDALRKQAKELRAFVDRLDGVLKESAGDEKALGLHKLIERAQLLEAEADFAEAIRLYDQVVLANPDQTAKIKTHVDQLKKTWNEKKDENARKFVYQVWPTLGVADLGKSMDQAKSALAACKKADDKLTVRKMLRVNVAHTVDIKTQLERLKRSDKADNRDQAKALAQVARALTELHNDAMAFVGPR
jgi:hypothetical protein